MTLKFRALFLGVVSFALGVLVLISNVTAQRPFDKFKEGLEDLRPKGELLKKIFGDKEDDKSDEKSNGAGQAGAQGERNGQYPADPRMAAEMQRRAALAQQQRQSQLQQQKIPGRMQQPTLAPAQANTPQRYPTGNPRAASPVPTRNADYRGLTPPPLPPQPHLANGGNAATIGMAQPVVEPEQSQAAGSNVDLGIVLREIEGKGLLIERIEARGFGAKSGLRKGDLIVGIGGIESHSKDEFNSIASVMREGDQIEFEVTRKGKAETVQVQFGESPELESDLEFNPQSSQRPAGGSIGDSNLDLSGSAPVDHVATLWSGSEGESSPNNGTLKSVLVNEPWPTASTIRNRR